MASEENFGDSWMSLNSVPTDRDWLTLGELQGILRHFGINMSRHRILTAVAPCPPKKQGRIKCYTQEHVALCRAAYRA